MPAMKSRRKTRLEVEGILHINATVKAEEAHLVKMTGVENFEQIDNGDGTVTLHAERHNAFVNQGLEVMLDRAYGISGPPSAISHIGVTSDSTAVTAASTSLDAGATGDLDIKPFSPAASRTNQTVDAGATFTEADVNYVMRKIGLLNGATDGNLIDAIGGGGAAPYDDSFTLDLTSTSTFSLDLGIQVTLSAT